MLLILSQVLSRFEIELAQDAEVVVDPQLTMRLKNGLPVRLVLK
jgi:hypothetical protein